jgi:Tfp pilus assembly protein PilV
MSRLGTTARRLRDTVRLDEDGISIVEVLVAISILMVGVVGLMGALSTGVLNVSESGGQSKATSYGRQKLEDLKSAAFDPGPTGPTTDTPEAGINRTWQVFSVAGFTAPNRLARIVVTVTWQQGTPGIQTITLETMRSE